MEVFGTDPDDLKMCSSGDPFRKWFRKTSDILAFLFQDFSLMMMKMIPP
jgi:hypothetical protein